MKPLQVPEMCNVPDEAHVFTLLLRINQKGEESQ